MAEQTSQEPTMEEILASIRRIISEDETPEAEAKATPPHDDEPIAPEPEAEPAMQAAPEPELEPEPAPLVQGEPLAAAPADEDDDALELTDRVETHGDLDVVAAEPAPAPPPRPEPIAQPAPAARPTPTLVSDRAAEAAASAFGKLSQVVAMPAEGRTLEDVVRELLRPLLQQWLDDHLPSIVEQAVQAEVERIARGRVG
ncbi:MAG: DUF2497 domain-containing protein [Alphaproteobacteria bacterium]|nr:DUF2497 domain-containing protein [Alphaproteobacteria bacterium]